MSSSFKNAIGSIPELSSETGLGYPKAGPSFFLTRLIPVHGGGNRIYLTAIRSQVPIPTRR